jgi:hypothetical protein
MSRTLGDRASLAIVAALGLYLPASQRVGRQGAGVNSADLVAIDMGCRGAAVGMFLLIAVIPSRKLVILRMGATRQDIGYSYANLLRAVPTALRAPRRAPRWS